MKKVLIVEDDSEMRTLYAQALAGDGFEVIAANSAQAALDALEEMMPDVVVLDIMLPVHNGITILYEMQSYDDWAEIPVIVLSAIPQEDIFSNDELMDRFNISKYCNKSDTPPTALAKTVAQVCR